MNTRTSETPPTNLQQRIDSYGDALAMLRASSAGYATFPFEPEFTNWRDEQTAWSRTATLFNQGEHMTEVTFDGPDLRTLLTATGINSFESFGAGRAKQFVAVNHDGFVIGDAILFGLGENRASLVGGPAASRWVQYHAETHDLDVRVIRDDWSVLNKQRRHFRYQIQGPRALDVIARAADGPIPDIPFFHIASFAIDGVHTRALSHSMSRRPGLEIWGARADGPRVLARLLRAGEEFGMRQGGAIAYSTTGLESGWWGMQLPAVYSGEQMEAYRRTIGLHTFEAAGSLGGSFFSEHVDDYYMTPWDLGFGKLIDFEHDFFGRDALHAKKDEPHRRKVWLQWNDEDVSAIMRDSLFVGDDTRPKTLRMPNANDSTFPADVVHDGEVPVGVSGRVGYTTNVGRVYSLATIDEPLAVDGRELLVTWGDSPRAPRRPGIERHTARTVRATVSTQRLA